MVHGPTQEGPGGQSPLNDVAETLPRRRPRIPSHRCRRSRNSQSMGTTNSESRRSKPIEPRCRDAPRAASPANTVADVVGAETPRAWARRSAKPGDKPLGTVAESLSRRRVHITPVSSIRLGGNAIQSSTSSTRASHASCRHSDVSELLPTNSSQ